MSAMCRPEVPNCCWLVDSQWFTLSGVYVSCEDAGVLALGGMRMHAGLCVWPWCIVIHAVQLHCCWQDGVGRAAWGVVAAC